jgi:MoaA/NifB/PqqE/SkfB family radical SAM enzyme
MTLPSNDNPSGWWLRELRSHYLSIALFRPFFPLRRLVLDSLRFPVDYLRDGTARPHPTAITINATNACNVGCSFCYNANNPNPESELTVAEIDDIARQGKAQGAGIFLSGGEPTLRRDLEDVVSAVHARGLPIGMVSNGFGMNQARIRRLLNLGLDSLIVSLHGAAGRNGSDPDPAREPQRCLEGIGELARRMAPKRLILNFVVSRESVLSLRPFLDRSLAIPNLTTRLTHLSFITRAEERAHQVEWRARTTEQPVPVMSFQHEIDPEQFRDLPLIASDPAYAGLVQKPFLSPREIAAWYAPGFAPKRRCIFIWHSAHINSDGSVFPCQYYPVSMGNVRDEPLARIWNNDRYRAFRRMIRQGLLPGCSRCCKF